MDVLLTQPVGLDHPDDCRCGTCHCGCGQRTPISDRTNRTLGYVEGEPHRFARGHSPRNGRYVASDGYVKVYAPDHPRALRGHVYEHLLIAERALGKHLPDGAEVHHFNEDRSDNCPQNLVICQDHAFHALLHRRQRALAACGNANWLCCHFCGQHDDPSRLRVVQGKRQLRVWHRACSRERSRIRRLKARVAALPCRVCSAPGPNEPVRVDAESWEAACPEHLPRGQ